MRQRYSSLKVFRNPEKIASLPRASGEIIAPLHVRIKPTNLCNHRCSYCAYRASGLQLGQDMDERQSMPEAKLLEIVEDLAEMGVGAVTFSGGGEPLRHPGLVPALRVLARSGVRFATLTNGALLRGEAAELFARKGVWVRVSMDGWDAASYAAYRGVGPDEFAKVMANLKAFKRLGGACQLGVSYIVDAANHGRVFEFVSRLKDAGVDSVKVSCCIVSNDARANNEYHRPFFAAVREQLDRAAHDLADGGFEVYDAYHELDANFAKGYSWCPYQQILPVIGADLNVYSCQDKAYNLREGLLGSIAGQRFKDFWFSDKSRFFRIDPMKHCNHHCVANAKNRLIHEFLGLEPDHAAFV